MSREIISRDRLRECLDYNKETGVFTWLVYRKGSRGIKPGKIAGTTAANGYRYISVCGQRYLAHRLAWLHIFGEWPALQIDHCNGDQSDNRLANLREATISINMQNVHRPQKNNVSGIMGVRKCGKRWTSTIYYGRKQHYLGLFDTPEQAHCAYLAAKRKYHEGNTL